MGRTGALVAAEPVRRHVRELMAAGAGYRSISTAAGVNVSIINHLLYDHGHKKRSAQLISSNASRILQVRIKQVATGVVDSTGAIRRLHALMAMGWPSVHVARHTRLYVGYLKEIQRQDKIYASTAHDVAVAYNRLWNQDPLKHGVSQQAVNRLRNYARKHGWPPPGAWDDESLDDPNAHPDWTGCCGTDRGWWMHKQQQLPMCDRCQEAHTDWLAERKHLPQGERFRALGIARGEASNRGAALAEDARELMRITGIDVELAAERLGVTTSHLHQELGRHPEPAKTAA